MRPAAIVLAHGLNTSSEVMSEIGEFFQQQECKLFFVQLTGHDGDRASLREAGKEVWLHDIRLVSLEAARYAESYNMPLYFCGYSLGALLGALFVVEGFGSFSKMVLFAPPFTVKTGLRMLVRCAGWLRSFPIPSMTPKDIRVYRSLPFSIYSELIKMVSLLRSKITQLSSQDMLFLCDPKDELISYEGLELLLQKAPLQNSLLREVAGGKNGYHHLVVSEKAVGHLEWQRVLDAISLFLP